MTIESDQFPIFWKTSLNASKDTKLQKYKSLLVYPDFIHILPTAFTNYSKTRTNIKIRHDPPVPQGTKNLRRPKSLENLNQSVSEISGLRHPIYIIPCHIFL